jgi:peptidoglycan/LPS O-acetylase OafA/YrhL
LLALTAFYPDLFAYPGGRWLYLFATAILIPALFLKTSRLSLDRFIGELSYPLYLCHILLISIIDAVGPQVTTDLRIGLTIFLSVTMSVLIEILLNDPIDRYRQRRVARQSGTVGATQVSNGSLPVRTIGYPE